MPPPQDLVSEQRLRESFIKHAVRAQLHRLCDYRARGADSPADLRIEPAMVGHSAPAASRSIERCDLDLGADGLIAFKADFSGGETWRGAFQRGSNFLPELKHLAIAPGASMTAQTPADHRIRSAVHYFLALVENPARDPEPFRELLADAFSLHYTAAPITDFDTVRTWVTGRLASVVASEHDIHSITCNASGGGDLTAEVVMKSQALFPDGSGAISRNTQRWTLRDDLTERFPRISEILIDRDAVEFFGPAPDYEPRALPG